MSSKGIPTKPVAKRINKRPLFILFTVLSLIIFLCLYVVTQRQKRLEKSAAANNIIESQPINDNTPAPEYLSEGYAQTLEELSKNEQERQQAEKERVANPIKDKSFQSDFAQKEVKSKKTADEQTQLKQPIQPLYQESGQQIEPKKTDKQVFQEKVANEKREMALKALRAPTLVSIGSATTNTQPVPQMPQFPRSGQNQIPGMMIPDSEKIDQTLKQEFLANAGENQVSLINAYRPANSPFELKQGHLIPMTLITKINSDLPGRIKAQVTENVYDTATGNHLLIPQGTMVNGIYDSRVVFGQKRVLIAWQRLIFPDGSSLNVGSMPGTDQAGTTGLKDLVDNHYFQVFGAAILMSVVNAAFTIATDTDENTGTVESVSDTLAKSTAQQMQQTFSRIIDKIMNIQPELIIRQGKEGHIILTKDVIGLKPYDPAKKPTYFLKTADVN
ncbi:MAG: hypothetical protein KKD32_03745 [Proteobacteria bacterium]|nr:hypothetical protein [Pseudomonadota bacterium]MBU1586274.1 hypothetical protein [Pseudomonadota bacterium]MBU2453170.1 hypothetical protein [Pseudomonadota bacterium]MBU2630799.1 hypothetical protein [Pseudomonadota bacterium]